MRTWNHFYHVDFYNTHEEINTFIVNVLHVIRDSEQICKYALKEMYGDK